MKYVSAGATMTFSYTAIVLLYYHGGSWGRVGYTWVRVGFECGWRWIDLGSGWAKVGWNSFRIGIGSGRLSDCRQRIEGFS